jgi:hypothetical protein
MHLLPPEYLALLNELCEANGLDPWTTSWRASGTRYQLVPWVGAPVTYGRGWPEELQAPSPFGATPASATEDGHRRILEALRRAVEEERARRAARG